MMKMNRMMAIFYGMLVVGLLGCTSNKVATSRPISPSARSSAHESPHVMPEPPKVPTPRERAATICNDLWKRIQLPMIDHRYGEARKIALAKTELTDAEVAPMLLAFRIGLVNSVINPAECEWLCDELQAKVEAYCKEGDFASAYSALDEANQRLGDISCKDVDEAMSAIHKELDALFYSEAAAKRYLAKTYAQVEALLGGRKGKPVMRGSLSERIAQLESVLRSEIPEDQVTAVERLIGEMRGDVQKRNVTTFDEREIIRQRISVLREQIAVRAAVAKGVIDLENEIAQVDLENEIALMEDAARRRVYCRGLLFAECAHSLRALRLNKPDQVNFQDILSASVLMRNEPLIEMAVRSGAGVNLASPGDPTLPILLAVEVGDVKLIAKLFHMGARVEDPQVSADAFGIAIKHDRLALFKFLETIGCRSHVQELFSQCCVVGADEIFGYLVTKGAKPTAEDFNSAVAADNLIIVKRFVEEWNFNVNADGVHAAAKDKFGVCRYLTERGMQ